MNKYINCSLLLLLCCVLTLQLWAQEAQLVPTGRSLPDTIPSDEIIYLGPFVEDIGNPNPIYAPAPDIYPVQDYSTPRITNAAQTAEPPTEIPLMIPREEPDGTPEQMPINMPSYNPATATNNEVLPSVEPDPNYSVSVGPDGQPEYTPEGYVAPEQHVNSSPQEQLSNAPEGYIGPDGTVYRTPDSEVEVTPGDEVVLGPDSQVEVEPEENIVTAPSTEPELDTRVGNDSADNTNNNSTDSKWFTLRPTDDRYPPVPEARTDSQTTIDDTDVVNLPPRSEEYPIKDNQIIALQKVQANSLSDMQVITLPSTNSGDNVALAGARSYHIPRLARGKYIQLFSYRALKQAENKADELLQDYPDSIVLDKLVVYKPSNSSYYRVYLGPYESAEVGVQLYTLRAQGFSKAFAINQ